MAAPAIRIGIIGAGANTRKVHLPQLQSLAGVRVVEVANRTRASSEKAAAEFQIPRVRDHWQEVAASPEVDAVVIGTWPYLHAAAACAALQAGKHVLCEARMAMNAAEARLMLSTARKFPHLIAQVVPSPFTLRIDATLQRMLEQKQLGRLRHFTFEYSAPPPHPPGGPLHWRRNIKYSGLNVMVLGIAYESVLRWLGPADWVSAAAHIFSDRAVDPDTHEEVTVAVPDYLSVQMKMQNGMMGTLLLFETGGPQISPRFRIYGEGGTLEAAFQVDGELRWGEAPDSGAPMKPVDIPPKEAGRWRVEEEFVNAIRGQEPVRYTTFETGVEYMVFTEAVHRSWKMDGIPVSLSDI